MSEAKFSPGPWEIYDRDIDPHEVCIDAPSWGSLAKVVIRMDGEGLFDSAGIANSHLIAAAPDLYEALDNALDILIYDQRDYVKDIVTECKMALAKARGENS